MYRDVSVGIATRYGLDAPGIEYRYGREFPQPSRLALGPIQRPVQGVPDLLPGVKQLGRGVDHPPPSKAKVEETVELYLYSPCTYLHGTSAERHYMQIYYADYPPNRALKVVMTNRSQFTQLSKLRLSLGRFS